MSRYRDFLVEIGTEELPPKSLLALASAFAEGVARGLDAAGLPHGAIERFATPRRLAVRVRRLSDRQPDRTVERRGPPVKAAFDASGAPTQAALAFAKSCGVELPALGRLESEKGSWLIYRGNEPGAATIDLLPGILSSALDALPVARRMRWGSGEEQFVRPVHWVLTRFGKDVVACRLLGVEAAGVSHGHRFMAPRPITIATPASYLTSLHRRGKVLADLHQRRETIREGVAAAATGVGGEAVIDESLLEEVTALVEWPVPLTGRFDVRFLELPEEVLIATLQEHQRYFPVRDAQGRLMPCFVAVANIESRDPAQVVAGNERVVRPRLADAEFFWNTDRRTALAARSPELARVTYQARLGSLHDKTGRVRALARSIAAATGADPALADRAAELAKCDLLTGMVGEFPELQGVMGRYYASNDGEPAEVCEAIHEQYLPRFAGDVLPSTGTGMALSIADRLDTIAGIFAAGQKPTGNRDPFGLRRAALGMLRTAIERRLDLDLPKLIADSLAALPFPAAAGVATEIYDYVMDRLRAYYLEGESTSAVTPEMFDAVLATRPSSPLDFDARLRALSEFLDLPDAQSLAAANKRIANILRKSEEPVGEDVDADLLIDPAEQVLAEQIAAMARKVEPEFAARRYTEALRQLAALRPAVDAFFDSVMVMAEDERLRRNRLAMLGRMRALFMHVADLSRLPG
ncbi:MAG TPA: glycine--tRNA ligase subunit beta [Steroidobacteraceae bacterium]|nr:glycine--tRNA ligase subunit beta [Steroidobacteraceae bacterium]